jgi:predicted transcriptional regulator
MLANQILQGSNRVDLKHFSAEVAEAATSLRTLIEKKDKKERIRGTELYIALPKKDPNSQQRFINYYVGKTPNGKWTDGILTGLGLARIEQADDGSVVLGLTESGRTLGCMSSPLIDEFLLQGKPIDDPLSAAEVKFLLEHLRANRPGEFQFMLSVLRLIKEGTVTPTTLRQKVNLFLSKTYPTMKISEKFVNTLLVGLMGRLVEMRLVEITKDAQKSKYSITVSGEPLIRGGKT